MGCVGRGPHYLLDAFAELRKVLSLDARGVVSPSLFLGACVFVWLFFLTRWNQTSRGRSADGNLLLSCFRLALSTCAICVLPWLSMEGWNL